MSDEDFLSGGWVVFLSPGFSESFVLLSGERGASHFDKLGGGDWVDCDLGCDVSLVS